MFSHFCRFRNTGGYFRTGTFIRLADTTSSVNRSPRTSSGLAEFARKSTKCPGSAVSLANPTSSSYACVGTLKRRSVEARCTLPVGATKTSAFTVPWMFMARARPGYCGITLVTSLRLPSATKLRSTMRNSLTQFQGLPPVRFEVAARPRFLLPDVALSRSSLRVRISSG